MQQQEELLTIPGKWNFEYNYFAGETASRFFRELRDNKKIYGTRCAGSNHVMVPARSFSDASYLPATEWVEVGPVGTLDIFTIVGAQFPGLPAPPYVFGYVTLDNANTAILNLVTGIDLSNLDQAAESLLKRPRVRAVFSDNREGRITDFHFELEG